MEFYNACWQDNLVIHRARAWQLRRTGESHNTGRTNPSLTNLKIHKKANQEQRIAVDIGTKHY